MQLISEQRTVTRLIQEYRMGGLVLGECMCPETEHSTDDEEGTSK